jgi:predicted esterase
MMRDRSDSSKPTPQPESPQDFYTLQKQIFELYHLGKYRAALTLADKATARFPGKDDRTTYWKACLYSRLGELDEALKLLNEATRRGLWWSEDALKLETDLDSVRGKPEFKIFIAECERLKHVADRTAKPELTVLTPADYSSRKALPLLIALHPRGEDFEDFVRLWRHALSKDVIVAFPRSSQLLTSHSRCWDDLARSEKEVAEMYSQLTRSYKLDKEKMILSGFSQGATLAIYLALKGNIRVRGFIAVAPASSVIPSHSEEFASFVKAAEKPGLKGWLLVGDKDRFFERVSTLLSNMRANGLRSEYVVEHGLGHAYPDDFAGKLEHAVDFVLN